MEQIRPLTYLSGYRANCYLVWSQGEAALVDPTASPNEVAQVLSECGLRLKYLLLTHAHYDHLITLYDPTAFSELPVYIHAADAPALGDVDALVANVFGVRTPHTTQTDRDACGWGCASPRRYSADRASHPGTYPRLGVLRAGRPLADG